MDQTIVELFHRFAGLAFDRQQRFAEFVAKKAPGARKSLDVEAGQLHYGPKLQFEAHLAGVHAELNGSWTWTWANRTIRLSLTNRALGDTIRALAHRVMSPVFAKPAFPLDLVIGPDLTPHAVDLFGVILVGELDSDAYLAGTHDGHPALFLIRDERLRTTEKHPLSRVLGIFPKMLKALPLTDHRTAFLSYVGGFGLHPVEEPDRVRVPAGKGELVATFDERGRLKSLQGVNVEKPKPKAVAKPAAKAVARAKPKAKPAAKKPARKPLAKRK